MQLQQIAIKDIVPNTGQIEGLPANPRFIKDEKFIKLVESLRSLPSLTDARPVIVYPLDGKFIAIAGNMRSRAAKELKWQTINCAILEVGTSAEVLREIAIKDNVGFGENDWDLLTNEWDATELVAWGMDVPDFGEVLEAEEEGEENEPENKNIWIPDCLFESNNILSINAVESLLNLAAVTDESLNNLSLIAFTLSESAVLDPERTKSILADKLSVSLPIRLLNIVDVSDILSLLESI